MTFQIPKMYFGVSVYIMKTLGTQIVPEIITNCLVYSKFGQIGS